MPWPAPSLSKGEMGKVDKFRFLTPPLRCSFSCCHMFSNDSSAEKNFLQRTKKETGYLHTKPLKSLGINVQGETGSILKIVFVHHNTEGKNNKKKKEKKMDCSCQCAVLDFVLWTSTKCSQCRIYLLFESASPPPTPRGFCLVALKQHHKYERWQSTKIWWAPHCKREQCRIKEGSLKNGAWGEWRKKNPEGHRWCVYVWGISHGCGLFDAMEADSCRRGGDRHGTCHTHSEGVMVLPAVPSFPGSRTDLVEKKKEKTWILRIFRCPLYRDTREHRDKWWYVPRHWNMQGLIQLPKHGHLLHLIFSWVLYSGKSTDFTYLTSHIWCLKYPRAFEMAIHT